MVRAKFVLILAVVFSLQAATLRLYLKDGTWHNVREYAQNGDRVRYYSTERGDWEEIPVDLVDLKKTAGEKQSREQAASKNAAEMDAEEKAERAQEEEIARIPMESGVFFVRNSAVEVVKQAETKIVNNRRRSILKAMSPIPIVSGRSTVELDGLSSAFSVTGTRPEFYIRLAAEERFHIVRTTAGKSVRIVQTWDIIPVTKEIVEKSDTVETFKQQLGPGLFKIWPSKDITPGEYAVLEYTEGKGNVQVWDFSVVPSN